MMICINVMTRTLRNILYTRRWVENNRNKSNAYKMAWAKANPEMERARIKTWRKAHPEKTRMWSANYAKAHPETAKAWAKTNPDKKRKHAHDRRARVLGAGGSFTVEQFKALGNVCLCCGLDSTELAELGRMLVPDHVMPISKGGSNGITNIQPLCQGKDGCNQHKGAKHTDYREKPCSTKKQY